MQLTGASGVRACFGVKEGKVGKHEGTGGGGGDGDELEAACESVLADHPVPERKTPTVDAFDDLEAALENAFLDQEDEDAGAHSEVPLDSSSDESIDTGIAVNDDESDVGHCTDGDDDAASEHEECSHLSPRFTRRGNKLLWDAVHVGTLTTFKGSVSCHCRIEGHRNCKSPASPLWPTDNVLVDWLLAGIGQDLSKDDHVRLGKLLLDEHRRFLVVCKRRPPQ